MGGVEFISGAEADILRTNVLISAQTIAAAVRARVARYFLSSSVCVYGDMEAGEPTLDEDAAYPALPDNQYGWEKLQSERLVRTWGRAHGLPACVALPPEHLRALRRLAGRPGW